MVQMSIASRTAVIGGLSLTLAMGAAPAMAAVSDGHATAVQVAKPKQKDYYFGVRVNCSSGQPTCGVPQTRTVPKDSKKPLTKTNVGANISIKANYVQGVPMKVQLFAKGGRPLGPVVTVKPMDKGKSIKLNRAKVKKGTKFYVLFKSSSRTRGSIMTGRVYY